MTPEIDVIVPQFNQSSHTLRFIRSFSDCAPPNARLILVENGSDPLERDAALEAISSVPHLAICNSENLGFVRAINQGICASTASLVVIQNNDTEIFPGCYERMGRILAADSTAGVVGPISSPVEGWQSIDNLTKRWAGFRRDLGDDLPSANADRAQFLAQLYGDRSRVIGGMVAFFCAMFPRSVIDEVGLLSTEYGVGLGDDDDYCARIRQGGRRVLLSLGTYVFHNHRTTFRALYSDEELQKMQERNIKHYKKKWRTDPLSGA